MATICNMGAEIGATTSVFPFTARMASYLKATSRGSIADLAQKHQGYLTADAEAKYDRVVEINLDELENLNRTEIGSLKELITKNHNPHSESLRT